LGLLCELLQENNLKLNFQNSFLISNKICDISKVKSSDVIFAEKMRLPCYDASVFFRVGHHYNFNYKIGYRNGIMIFIITLHALPNYIHNIYFITQDIYMYIIHSCSILNFNNNK
jgi:hypothetical protein